MEIKIVEKSKNYIHKELAAGKWQQLSLMEQMGNIGSEVSRALNWRDKNQESYNNAIDRALELLDLTINDSRWKNRLKEIARVRELLCGAISGGKEYKTSLKDLDGYFFHFALAARVKR
ncbi:hypothetical protein HY838_01725 [Candidatus Azambacteria bacterium]|nr:hypothetical protein [Candidatus Azambacteria bacterium]